MNGKTPYEILGVPQEATLKEIKAAYRELAKEHHPDKNPDATEEDKSRFTQIAEAYSILSNLNKRRDYDRRAFPQKVPQPAAFWFMRPHYSGYPYFQWDFFTPAFHSFFIGSKKKPIRNGKSFSPFY